MSITPMRTTPMMASLEINRENPHPMAGLRQVAGFRQSLEHEDSVIGCSGLLPWLSALELGQGGINLLAAEFVAAAYGSDLNA